MPHICGALWAFYKTPTAQPTRNLRVADIAMAPGDTALKVAWKNVEQGIKGLLLAPCMLLTMQQHTPV